MKHRPIRQSQLISPFGIGAMVDFRNDESLMLAGLDVWPKARDRCPDDWLVNEERLEARLQMNHFRLPPDYRDDSDDPLARQAVPFVRFPCWHYCPKCGSMKEIQIYGSRVRCEGKTGICKSLSERNRLYLIPVRIVAVCPRGHIEDFPFMKWVHNGEVPDGGVHTLQFLASRSSASLAGIKIKCICGASRSLAGAFEFSDKGGALHKIGHDCSGNRPWLGETGEHRGTCGQMLRVVQRGASNVYFPLVVSSIYLPLWAEQEEKAVIEVLENPRFWGAIFSGLEEGTRIDKIRCSTIADITNVNPDKLYEAAQKKLDGRKPAGVQTNTEEQFRLQEYVAIREGRGRSETDLLVEVVPGNKFARLGSVLERVCLIRKLRETRVLAGFTRLLPAVPSDATNIEKLCIDENIRWRPAAVVRGEGIFIEIKKNALDVWSIRSCVRQRIDNMTKQLNVNRIQRGLPIRQMNARFVLLHTLAHALISQLSFACGYGSASLRERIYCNLEGEDAMHGLLVYTASGDSEGTLGGLVRQGEPSNLPAIVLDALSRAKWCSSDPICIESSGQGIENANLAACHGCLLLPETCCEEGNRNLDRAMLIGTPQKKEIGFFSSLSED